MERIIDQMPDPKRCQAASLVIARLRDQTPNPLKKQFVVDIIEIGHALAKILQSYPVCMRIPAIATSLYAQMEEGKEKEALRSFLEVFEETSKYFDNEQPYGTDKS